MGIIGMIVAVMAIFNWRAYQQRVQLDRQLAQAKKEFLELEERKIQLQEDIAKSKTEEYLEKIARERLNLKKKGEKVVKIIFPEKTASVSIQEEKRWWNKILEKINMLFKRQ